MQEALPMVTVFMAAYNAEKYIAASINSVLDQDYRNFELLIINDGSSDKTLEVIQQFKDDRIRLLNNDGNKGLFYTRNRGIDEARGKYFAINDADDLSVQNRLSLQVEFLEANGEVAVCGGNAISITENDDEIATLCMNSTPEQLKYYLLFHNIFVNSTVMIRTEILRQYQYRPGYEPAEDYEMFSRISFDHKIANLNTVLSKYRIHNSNTSSVKKDNLIAGEKKIIESNLLHYGFNTTAKELDYHYGVLTGSIMSSADLKNTYKYLRQLLQQAKQNTTIVHKQTFSLVLQKQMQRVVQSSGFFLSGTILYLLLALQDMRNIYLKPLIGIPWFAIKKATRK